MRDVVPDDVAKAQHATFADKPGSSDNAFWRHEVEAADFIRGGPSAPVSPFFHDILPVLSHFHEIQHGLSYFQIVRLAYYVGSGRVKILI
jgi:hypothetical protein